MQYGDSSEVAPLTTNLRLVVQEAKLLKAVTSFFLLKLPYLVIPSAWNYRELLTLFNPRSRLGRAGTEAMNLPEGKGTGMYHPHGWGFGWGFGWVFGPLIL